MRNVLKIKNPETGEFEPIAAISGADGAPGANGQGVPTGGTAGQVLKKTGNGNYETEWSDKAGDSERLGGVAAAQYALKNNVPAHNLLDNSDFTNPVNQRGIANSATIERYTYFLDRWRTGDTAGTITLDSNGLIFNVLISQKINPAILRTGTAVTAAAKFSDGTLVIVSGVVNLSTSWHWLSSPVVDGCQIGLIDGTSDGIPYVRIGNEDGKTLVWAALYEGSYDASTLPAYQPKGYAAELAECQRYYQVFGKKRLVQSTEPNGGFTISERFPIAMRVTPTIKGTYVAWATLASGPAAVVEKTDKLATNESSADGFIGYYVVGIAKEIMILDYAFTASADL